MFRLQNFHSLHVSESFTSQITKMTARIKDIAHALAVPLLGDAESERKLIAVLDQHDSDSRVQRLLEPEWLIAEALFDLCHQDAAGPNRLLRQFSSILVGGIAHNVNVRMSERGEEIRMSAKRAGLILRALGVRTKSLGKLGRGIEFTSVVREKVHELSRQFGFDRRTLLSSAGEDQEYGGAPCTLCEKYDLSGGLKFVALAEWETIDVKRRKLSRG